MKEKILKLLENKKVMSYLLIFLVSIFVCIPLFSNNMDISRDDGIQHISRLIGTSQTLKEGVFPTIISDFCNGFGYSWNLFYSPLTAYLPLLFNFFTSSFVICLKLFIFATMFFSGVFMFQLVKKISKSYVGGVLAAMIYITAPYHLTDLYYRVAVAELATFMFLPIVFLGIQYLLEKNYRKSYYIAIGAIGLILSHNVIAMYTAIICAIYLAIHYKDLKDKKIIQHLCINAGIILLCVSFYLLPLLQHYLATSYSVFVPGRMYSTNTLISSKLVLSDLFITRPYNMTFHIGFPIIVGLILMGVYYKKIHAKDKKTLVIFLIFGLVSIVMSTKLFPFEYLPSIFKMIQFQWRMLEFSSFFLSILSGITIAMYLHNKKDKKNTLIELALILYTTILLLSIKTSILIPFDERNFLKPNPITTATQNLHTNCATFEYLPQKAYENLDYIIDRKIEAIVLEGNVTITEQSKKGNYFTCQLEDIQEELKIELPYIYYLGYDIRLTTQEGKIEKIPYTESDKGFICIQLSSQEKGRLEVKYTGTVLMKISYILTTVGVIVLILYRHRNRKN